MLPAWLALLGCGEPDTEWTLEAPTDDGPHAVVHSAVVEVRSAPAALQVGSHHNLDVVVRRGDNLLPDAAVSFASSHPGVVSVDRSGRLAGVATGTAWVTAESEGAVAMMEIRVE